jgi:exonuclease I
MAIPKQQHATFKVTVPSTKEAVKFRPFTVKEEKILLLASSSKDSEEILDGVKAVVSNCLQGEIDFDNLPLFDIEYFIIKLSAASVNNIVERQYYDQEDDKTYDIEINLDEVEVRFDPEHTNKIEIGNGVGMIMKYPNFKMVMSIQELVEKINKDGSVANTKESIDALFALYSKCIKQLYDEDNIYVNGVDFDDKEAIEFLDNLSSASLQKVQKFFDTIPQVSHDVKYQAKGGEKTITLTGLSNFF